MKVKDQVSGKIEKKENSVSNSIVNYCEYILCSNTIDAKLEIINNVNWEFKEKCSFKDKYQNPGRPDNLKFSSEKIKFPKDHEFSQSFAKAKAIHFFANHELLAIEVMAKAILELPHTIENLPIKMEIWKTLQDEQRHLALYRSRLQDLGFDLGDFPVNDYFWKIFSKINSLESYFGLMALTFESANLDFAAFYKSLFAKYGDFVSSKLMEQIYNDEIHHVKLGFKFFSNMHEVANVWPAYVESLPWPVTPARSKGIHFKTEHRLKAGFSNDFINRLVGYFDNFEITERKR